MNDTLDNNNNNNGGIFGFFSNFAKKTSDATRDAVSGAASGAASMFLPPQSSESGMIGGRRRRKSRRARKGKRSKTVRRRKSRGRKLLQTTHPLHDRTKRMAMGRSQAQSQSQSRSQALAGGRVHAYSANEMSSMQPAYVNSKQGSFLLAGGKSKRKRKSKKGGQFWN